MKIEFKATIQGGPTDGSVFTFEGSGSEGVYQALSDGHVEIDLDGHIYKIQEFDRNSLTASVVW